MTTFIQLGEIATNPDPILRSLRDGPDYKPHWRFLIWEQHQVKVAQARDPGAALDDILSMEKDHHLRELLLFQAGRPSAIPVAMEYALRCYRSRNENPIAARIAAMVVAGRNSAEIAKEIGTEPVRVVAFEKIFFDVRRYLESRWWIKGLCFSPSTTTCLGERASRLLITACERGWAGLDATFSAPHSFLEPAGKRAFAQSFLGLSCRCGDFINALEMEGVTPSAQEFEILFKLVLFQREISPNLLQLDYPTPLSPEQVKRNKEAAKIAANMPLASRKRVRAILERIQANVG